MVPSLSVFFQHLGPEINKTVNPVILHKDSFLPPWMASIQNGPKIKHLIPLHPTPSGLSISITLLEQAIFVNASLGSPSVLRGCVELTVSKTVRLRDLVIKFRGVNKLGKFRRMEFN
jgi:hypothetical protein